MKKLTLLLLAASTALFFSSCGSKDNNTGPSVVGKWNVNKIRTKIDLASNNQNLIDTTEFLTNGEYYNFATNGTFTSGSDTSTTVTTGNYTLGNNILTLIESGDTSTFDVTQLTGTNFDFHQMDTVTYQGFLLNYDLMIYLTK